MSMHKLTPEQVIEIRKNYGREAFFRMAKTFCCTDDQAKALYKSLTFTYAELARKHNISPIRIQKVIEGTVYKKYIVKSDERIR